MKRLILGVLAMVAGASLGFGHAVNEYAHLAKDVAAIAVDVRDLFSDVVTDDGVHAATGDLVDAWGHLKAGAEVLRHGHEGKVEVAAKELHEAVTKAHDAYQALAGDPNLQDAAHRVADIAAKTADIVYQLRGGAELPVGESCSSRCKHECSGLNVASCALNCVHGHGCYPSCCGCKDGTTMCESCGATCDSADSACRVEPATVG